MTGILVEFVFINHRSRIGRVLVTNDRITFGYECCVAGYFLAKQGTDR